MEQDFVWHLWYRTVVRIYRDEVAEDAGQGCSFL